MQTMKSTKDYIADSLATKQPLPLTTDEIRLIIGAQLPDDKEAVRRMAYDCAADTLKLFEGQKPDILNRPKKLKLMMQMLPLETRQELFRDNIASLGNHYHLGLTAAELLVYIENNNVIEDTVIGPGKRVFSTQSVQGLTLVNRGHNFLSFYRQGLQKKPAAENTMAADAIPS